MGAFVVALPAFIQALPELIVLMTQFMNLVTRGVALLEKQKLSKWMSDVEEQIDLLEVAQTESEKLNAARGLVNVLRTLG